MAEDWPVGSDVVGGQGEEGTHRGDCISLIFSLASYGKKGWLAVANFLTADRTFLLGTR